MTVNNDGLMDRRTGTGHYDTAHHVTGRGDDAGRGGSAQAARAGRSAVDAGAAPILNATRPETAGRRTSTSPKKHGRHGILGSGIGRRLLFGVLIFSSVVTLILTTVQICFDYQRGVTVIERRLDEIRRSYLDSMGDALWHLDRTQLQLEIDGILRLPDMRAVEVSEASTAPDALIVMGGARQPDSTIKREIPITYQVDGKTQVIGKLYLEATLDDLYQTLLAQVLVILASQAAKTFLTSYCILFLCHRLITRHLVSIADYVHGYDLRSPPAALQLDRGPKARVDELDEVVGAFNNLFFSLQEAYDELRDANRQLADDIERRQKVEARLRDSEQRFRDFGETASDWFWETDAQHRFTYISERVSDFNIEGSETLIGRKRGDTAADLRTEPEKWRNYQRLIDNRKSFSDFTYRVTRLDGKPAYISVSGMPLFDEAGVFLGYRGISREVTTTVLADQSLRAAKSQAELANYAKTQFLANMSHELRTPLNAIIGMSEVIKQELLGPIGNDRYLAYASDIHNSGQSLLSVISEILDLTRIDTGQAHLDLGDVDSDILLREVAALNQPQIDAAALRVEVKPALPVPHLIADEAVLRRVIGHLLGNAIKFTPAGGRITLSSRNLADGSVEFTVADTGIGIAPKDIAKLSTPFAQLDNVYQRKYQGAGLGLALVRALVELQGGSFRIDSQPEKGTVVHVALPADGHALMSRDDERAVVIH